MSSPGSFPNKARICILIGFPTSSAPGTRKTGEGKGTQGTYLSLIPSNASTPELLPQMHGPGPATVSTPA